MSPGATFERVYHALKEQLAGGRFAAGAHLEPALLSQELNASITPVRDALHRLAGEGLLDTPRGDGFRTMPATEIGMRHLYRWNAALLGLAARTRRPADPPPRQDTDHGPPAGTIAATERLFLVITARSGNPEHLAAVARLNERLRPARAAELTVLGGQADELAAIAAGLAGGGPALARALTAFHRRRERHVPAIVAALVAPR